MFVLTSSLFCFVFCFSAGDTGTLLSPIISHYAQQGLQQAYKILGSFEFLGNPVALV
jgi:hypothetical protein